MSMQHIHTIIGSSSDEEYHNLMHEMEASGAVDFLELSNIDLSRRRFRHKTRKGVELAISLDRDTKLFDGAILEFCKKSAIIVKVKPEKWLKVKCKNASLNLKLGYFAGNLHWAVRFADESIFIEVQGDFSDYINRLESAFDMSDLTLTEVKEGGEV
jgi:urease accessory protein